MPADQSDSANEFSPDLSDKVRISDPARIIQSTRQPRVENFPIIEAGTSLRLVNELPEVRCSLTCQLHPNYSQRSCLCRGYYKMTGRQTTSLNKLIVCCVMVRAFHLDLELEIMVFKLAAFANYHWNESKKIKYQILEMFTHCGRGHCKSVSKVLICLCIRGHLVFLSGDVLVIYLLF